MTRHTLAPYSMEAGGTPGQIMSPTSRSAGPASPTSAEGATNTVTNLHNYDMGVLLRYNSPQLENLFLIHEHSRSSTVFLATCILITATAAFFGFTAPASPATTMVLITAGCALFCFFLSLVIYIMRRTSLRRQTDEVADGTSTKPLSILIVYARINECFAVLGSILLCLSGVFLYNLSQDHCRYLGNSDKEDNVDCPQRMYAYWFMTPTVFSLIVAQPRFIFMPATCVLQFILTASLVKFHKTSKKVHMMIGTIWVVFLAFVAALKYISEKQQRRRFMTQRLIATRKEEITQRTAELTDFVLAITPKHLHSRLRKDAAHRIQVDTSSDAVCLVVQALNATQFMHDHIPTKAALRLGVFRHQMDELCEANVFHHIRSFGDSTIMVANLFHQDHANLEAATLAAVRLATSVMPPRSEGHELQVCSGVAGGQLIGMPLGTTCIRYDLFGPALDNAQILASSCPPGCAVHVAGKLYEPIAECVEVLEPTKCTGDAAVVIALSHNDRTNQILSTKESDDEPFPRSSTSESIDVVHHTTSDIIRSDIVTVQSTMNLETETHCLMSKFVDKETEAMAMTHRRVHYSASFIMCTLSGGFHIGFIALLAIMERDRLNTNRLIGASCLLGACAVSQLVVGGIVFLRRRRLLPEPLQRWHQHVVVAVMVACLPLTALLRPTVAGESLEAATIGCCLDILFLGLGGWPGICVVIFLSVEFVIVSSVIFPLYVTGDIAFFFLLLVYVNACRAENILDRELFSRIVRANEALEEVQMHEKIREAMQAALVPLQLAHRITPDKLLNVSIDSWSVDESIAIVINVSGLTVGETGANTDVIKLQQTVASRMTLIENAVEQCPKGTLSIVKVFGGNVIVGGPFEEQGSNAVLYAIMDTMTLLSNLLAAKELHFTAGVALEQGINVLVTSSFPQYDLMGACMNMAKSLAAAAPTEMVVLSEKICKRYESECSRHHQGGCFDLCPAESWRIRDVGAVRVRRMQLL